MTACVDDILLTVCGTGEQGGRRKINNKAALAGAAVLTAAARCGCPRERNAVAAAAGVQQKALNKEVTAIKSEVPEQGLDTESQRGRLLRALLEEGRDAIETSLDQALPFSIIGRCAAYIQRLEDSAICSGKKPRTMAAAALHTVCLVDHNMSFSYKELGGLTGVSSAALSDTLKSIRAQDALPTRAQLDDLASFKAGRTLVEPAAMAPSAVLAARGEECVELRGEVGRLNHQPAAPVEAQAGVNSPLAHLRVNRTCECGCVRRVKRLATERVRVYVMIQVFRKCRKLRRNGGLFQVWAGSGGFKYHK